MQNSPKWLLDESLSRLDHNRLYALINSLEEGFLALDDDGRIELSNGVALDLLNDHSLNNKRLADAMQMIDSSDQPVDVLSLAQQANGSLASQDYRLRHHDGTIMRLNIRISPVRGYSTKQSGGYVVLLGEVKQ